MEIDLLSHVRLCRRGVLFHWDSWIVFTTSPASARSCAEWEGDWGEIGESGNRNLLFPPPDTRAGPTGNSLLGQLPFRS